MAGRGVESGTWLLLMDEGGNHVGHDDVVVVSRSHDVSITAVGTLLIDGEFLIEALVGVVEKSVLKHDGEAVHHLLLGTAVGLEAHFADLTFLEVFRHARTAHIDVAVAIANAIENTEDVVTLINEFRCLRPLLVEGVALKHQQRLVVPPRQLHSHVGHEVVAQMSAPASHHMKSRRHAPVGREAVEERQTFHIGIEAVDDSDDGEVGTFTAPPHIDHHHIAVLRAKVFVGIYPDAERSVFLLPQPPLIA